MLRIALRTISRTIPFRWTRLKYFTDFNRILFFSQSTCRSTGILKLFVFMLLERMIPVLYIGFNRCVRLESKRLTEIYIKQILITVFINGENRITDCIVLFVSIDFRS